MKTIRLFSIFICVSVPLVAIAQSESTISTNAFSKNAPILARRAAPLPLEKRELSPISNAASNAVTPSVIVRGESVQVIRSVPGGARADYGLQKVFFPLDARGTDVLTITTPDGGNVQPGEMRVLYKVFEYENPPELKLLNGFLTATTSIKITSQDPQVEQKKTGRLQERIKEGMKLVRERISSATQ